MAHGAEGADRLLQRKVVAMSAQLKALLMREEGVRLKPYLDCCGKYWRVCDCSRKGKLTLGVGRNLDDDGITEYESEWLLEKDIARVTAQADRELEWFSKLDPRRQDAVLSMLFNLGAARFREFKQMIAALEAGDYNAAADAMLQSEWAREVPNRAKELAEMMRKGWQP